MTTVLVVDDSKVDRRLAGVCVEEEGLRVVYAVDGRDALAQVAAELPDLVLTDLQMPEVDGLELVQELRARHPGIPVVLMTAHGSEELAVTALKTGAASYVPKKNLARDLGQTLRVVLSVASSRRELEQVLDSMVQTESTFVIGNDVAAIRPLIGHLQNNVRQMDLCDDADLLRVGTALQEALVNAIEHGNLEVSSSLRETSDADYYQQCEERAKQPPYRDRRVRLTSKLTRSRAVFAVRDEGPGFDPSRLSNPKDPANLENIGGRGMLLIRTFMDEVTFNKAANEITMIKLASSNE